MHNIIRMNHPRTIFTIVAIAAAVGIAASAVIANNLAYAKITPATPPSCTNGPGHLPGGQQPTCTGGGLDQNPGSQAKNPAGNPPPGQQP